jgi:hypothetical protein
MVAAAFGLVVLGPLGCAPRQSRTHFDRWADETKKRHAEEAEVEKPSDAPVAAAKPAAAAVKTATAASAVPIAKPAADEAIY